MRLLAVCSPARRAEHPRHPPAAQIPAIAGSPALGWAAFRMSCAPASCAASAASKTPDAASTAVRASAPTRRPTAAHASAAHAPRRASAGTTPGWTPAGRAWLLQRPAQRCSSTPASARCPRCALLRARARATARSRGAPDVRLGGRRLAATRSAGGKARTTDLHQRRRRHAYARGLQARRGVCAPVLTIAAPRARLRSAAGAARHARDGQGGQRVAPLFYEGAPRSALQRSRARRRTLQSNAAVVPRHARCARRWSPKGEPPTTRLRTSW